MLNQSVQVVGLGRSNSLSTGFPFYYISQFSLTVVTLNCTSATVGFRAENPFLFRMFGFIFSVSIFVFIKEKCFMNILSTGI